MNEDFKTHLVMVLTFIVILVAVGGGVGFCAYKVGNAKGKLEGTLTAYQLHPPTTITGPGAQIITNNNVRTPNNKFSVGVWPLHLGWCE